MSSPHSGLDSFPRTRRYNDIAVVVVEGLWDEMPPTRGISCLSLVLYGISQDIAVVVNWRDLSNI